MGDGQISPRTHRTSWMRNIFCGAHEPHFVTLKLNYLISSALIDSIYSLFFINPYIRHHLIYRCVINQISLRLQKTQNKIVPCDNLFFNTFLLM